VPSKFYQSDVSGLPCLEELNFPPIMIHFPLRSKAWLVANKKNQNTKEPVELQL